MGIFNRIERRLKRVATTAREHVLGPKPPSFAPRTDVPVTTNSSTSADGFATADRAVLTGLVGIRMAIAPTGRAMLVNHWATWCSGCVDELPALVDLRERHRGSLDIIAVGWEGFQGASPDEQLRSVERVAEEHGLDWPTLVFDGSAEVLFEGLGLDVHTIPQTHLYSADGELIASFHEPLDEAAIATLDALLN